MRTSLGAGGAATWAALEPAHCDDPWPKAFEATPAPAMIACSARQRESWDSASVVSLEGLYRRGRPPPAARPVRYQRAPNDASAVPHALRPAVSERRPRPPRRGVARRIGPKRHFLSHSRQVCAVQPDATPVRLCWRWLCPSLGCRRSGFSSARPLSGWLGVRQMSRAVGPRACRTN